MSDGERSNQEWLEALRQPGPAREAALADLRRIILKGLPYALSRWLDPRDPQFDALAEEVAQETLLRVLDHLESFEGRSRFTTWVHKIAVRVALSELRRKRWQDISLEELTSPETSPDALGLFADPGPDPETRVERADLMAAVRRAILEDLTEKQRTALIATRVHGMPIEEVARRMGMNRNALYKLLHDARLRLKRALAEQGLSPEEILSTFET